MTPELTPSSTVGPYFGIALTPRGLSELVADDTAGAITFRGTVTDGVGKAVPEAMIEIWQADQRGDYGSTPLGENHGFTGFGRCHTDDEGNYSFRTVKPGAVPALEGDRQAPHINIAIFGGGLLKPLRTRAYFSDEAAANSVDPALAMVDEDRRGLLVAEVAGNIVTFDICLQGDLETPFFEV